MGNRKERLKFILGQPRCRWASLLLLIWGFLNSVAITIVQPLGFKYLFDEGIIRRNFRFFALIGLVVVIFGTLWRLSDFSLELYRRWLKNRLLGVVSSRMLEACHYLPYMRVLRKGTGYFVARIYDEAKNATEPLVDNATAMFQGVAMVMGSLGLCLYLSPKLTGMLLIIIVGLTYGARYFGAKIQAQSKSQQEWEAELKGVVVGIVQALKETRLFRLLDRVRETFQRAFQRYANTTYTRQKTAGAFVTLSGIFLSWAELVVILGAGYSVLVGELTFGGMMAIINAYWFGVNGFRQFINSLPMLSQVLASTDRLIELDRESAKLRLTPTRTSTSDEIQLNGVSFAYDDRPVFQGLSLKIDKGERVLIQGPNGSGKSTLALIMAGYLEPQRGSIIIPERISAIIQPVHFPPIPLEDLCPRRKEANELFREFGLLEHLNSTFDRLSEGQRTKFAVAFALSYEADCYILDEPLAAVDQESAGIVIKEILKRTEGKTLVVILHGGEAFRDQFDKVFTLYPRATGIVSQGNDVSSFSNFLQG